MKLNYNSTTDVLYLTFIKAKADETIMDDEFIVYRYKDKKLLGITIDGFKDRIQKKELSKTFLDKYIPEETFKTLIKRIKEENDS